MSELHDAVTWRMFKILTQDAEGLGRWLDRPWLPLAFRYGQPAARAFCSRVYARIHPPRLLAPCGEVEEAVFGTARTPGLPRRPMSGRLPQPGASKIAVCCVGNTSTQGRPECANTGHSQRAHNRTARRSRSCRISLRVVPDTPRVRDSQST
jgi:hypothetical protein